MGEILSLLSGVSFAGSNVFTRRGVFYARESFSALPITIGIGLVIFFMALLMSGIAGRLGWLSWIGILSLGGAGVLHFLIGRAFNYTSLRLIGANRTEPLLTSNMIFSIILGLIFLNETLTLPQVLGIAAVCLGVVLIGTSAEGFSKGTKLAKSVLLKGTAAGLLAGFCYGTSTLFIKIGLQEVGSGIAGGFVSHLAAGLVVAVFMIGQEHRSQVRRLNRVAFVPMVIGGVALALGQIFRYVALELVPINVVAPLMATVNLFVPVFSFLVNRKMEVFSAKVVGGSVAVIVGVYVILLVRL